MPRSLTSAQLLNVNANATAPIYLVEISHSGSPELLSVSGDVVYNERLFTAGGCSVTNIVNGAAATVTLPWTAQRIAEVQSGTWRDGICKIWTIPAGVADERVFVSADGILLLDGKIRVSSFSGDKITVQAAQISEVSRVSPRHSYDDVSLYIPPAGSSISWENDRIVLESQ